MEHNIKSPDNEGYYSKFYNESNRLTPLNIDDISLNLMGCIKIHIDETGKNRYINHVVANSTAEPENSNIRKADNSTPLNRAFIVCSTRTPKENNILNLAIIFLSMVACNRKGFALCRIPCVAVSQPVTRYRPSLRTYAVTSKNLRKELLAMIYLLLCVNRKKTAFNTEIVRIQAPNQEEARFKLTADYQLLKVCGWIKGTPNLTAKIKAGTNNSQLFGTYRIPVEIANNDENLTACNIAVLPMYKNERNIESTTNSDGDRSHYPSGIFLSKNHSLRYELIPRIYQYIDFAIRAIPRNKASNRTNNRSRSLSVVESLSHPTKVDNLLTKNSEKQSMKTIHTALSGILNRLLAFTDFSALNKGGLYV